MANSRTTGFVRVDPELELCYEVAGRGARTLVFIPGWTMTTSVFERQLSHFANSSEFRFLTYDPRAHGRSTATRGGHHYEQHGRDLNGLIKNLALTDIVLCGWSYGVLDMLAYIDQFGSRRGSGVIVLDGAPTPRGPDNQHQWHAFRHDDADGMEEFFTLEPLRDRAAMNTKFASWMLEDQSPENIAWVCEMTNHTSDEIAGLLNAAGAFLDYEPLLATLSASLPVWLVVSKVLEAPVIRWRDSSAPNARVSAFGKHLMFWERADEFNRLLEEFLATVPLCRSTGRS